jgi:hypothetical protein
MACFNPSSCYQSCISVDTCWHYTQFFYVGLAILNFWGILVTIYIYLFIGKSISIQVWTGPEVSRTLRLLEFQNIRHLKVVRLSAVRTGRLYPRKYIHISPNIPLIYIYIYTRTYIEADQKVFVHLTVTVHHQVLQTFWSPCIYRLICD